MRLPSPARAIRAAGCSSNPSQPLIIDDLEQDPRQPHAKTARPRRKSTQQKTGYVPKAMIRVPLARTSEHSACSNVASKTNTAPQGDRVLRSARLRLLGPVREQAAIALYLLQRARQRPSAVLTRKAVDLLLLWFPSFISRNCCPFGARGLRRSSAKSECCGPVSGHLTRTTVLPARDVTC